MNAWLVQFKSLFDFILADPQTHAETITLSFLGFFAFLLIMTKTADLLGAPVSSVSRSLGVLVPTLAFWMAGSTALTIYVAPGLSPDVASLIPLVCIPLIALVVSFPLSCWLQKVSYGKAAALVVIGLAGTMAVILLAGAAFDAARRGSQQGSRIKDRTGEMNEFINK